MGQTKTNKQQKARIACSHVLAENPTYTDWFFHEQLHWGFLCPYILIALISQLQVSRNLKAVWMWYREPHDMAFQYFSLASVTEPIWP